MKNMMITFGIILFIINTAWTQSFIGIRNKQDISTLSNYRLPDWGYSTFLLGADGRLSNGANDRSKTDSESSSRMFEYDIALNPVFSRYSESEKLIPKAKNKFGTFTSISILKLNMIIKKMSLSNLTGSPHENR